MPYQLHLPHRLNRHRLKNVRPAAYAHAEATVKKQRIIIRNPLATSSKVQLLLPH